MFKDVNAHHVRRLTCGACLMAAPLILLASSIVAPYTSSAKEAPVLRAIAANQDRFYISTVMLIAGLILLLGAVLGLMHMLRERQSVLGHVGGALSLMGVMTFMLYGGISLMQWQMVRGGADRGQMLALLHRLMHTTGTQVFMWLSLSFTVGMLMLALGLYLARSVHWSMSGAIAAGVVVLQVAIAGNRSVLFIVASGLLFVALAAIGWQVVGETDDEWEHTPTFRGFRPAASH